MWRRWGGGGGEGKCCFICLSFSSSQFTVIASLVDKMQGRCVRAGTDPVRENGGRAERFPFMGLAGRSAIKLSPDGCSSGHTLFPKEFPLLHPELTGGNNFAEAKNKLPQKTFYSVLYEELELGKVLAAVVCAFNASLHRNREPCVSIIWLYIYTHFLFAQLILWTLSYIFKLKSTLSKVVLSRDLLLKKCQPQKHSVLWVSEEHGHTRIEESRRSSGVWGQPYTCPQTPM